MLGWFAKKKSQAVPQAWAIVEDSQPDKTVIRLNAGLLDWPGQKSFGYNLPIILHRKRKDECQEAMFDLDEKIEQEIESDKSLILAAVLNTGKQKIYMVYARQPELREALYAKIKKFVPNHHLESDVIYDPSWQLYKNIFPQEQGAD